LETELGLRIIERLGYGKANAVTSEKLCQMVGVPDRKLREVIRELIAEGWPVLSNVTGAHKGFYLAQSKEEVDEYAKSLRDRLIEIALRRRDLLRATRVIRHPEQLVMVMR
jgi:hypothetical protein